MEMPGMRLHGCNIMGRGQQTDAEESGREGHLRSANRTQDKIPRLPPPMGAPQHPLESLLLSYTSTLLK